jgi:xanthine dehydrogenase YagS FAD-binding subunit
MCVALAALAAKVQVTGPAGDRTIAFADFHRLPGDTPEVDTNLQRGELITAIELPAEGFAENHTYLKIRDRHSYAFALVSVAVGLKMQGDRIGEARLALGGVAHKPWRDVAAEAMLRGEAPDDALFTEVGRAIVRDARGFGHNDFKIELARRAVVRALRQAVGMEART